MLEIENLSVSFPTGRGERFFALKNVSLALDAGRIQGLVGESGAGKSLLALSLLGLLPETARIESGRILFESRDVLTFTRRELRFFRRDAVGIIWQNPQASLVPVYSVERQLGWILKLHGERGGRKILHRRCEELLGRVGIGDPERILRQHPAQLSGGECQRVMIAMALAARKRFLIADEPTSALDATTEAGIIRLLLRLHRETDTALLFVTHNLALAAKVSHSIGVMFQGELVENAEAGNLLADPQHAYTRTLFSHLLFQPVHTEKNASSDVTGKEKLN